MRGLKQQLAKRIRVYELAKEIGLSNKGAYDLCLDLGIGLKSPSSSIEDAQADRVRRKVAREGTGKYESADAHSHSDHSPEPHAETSSHSGKRTPEKEVSSSREIVDKSQESDASRASARELASEQSSSVVGRKSSVSDATPNDVTSAEVMPPKVEAQNSKTEVQRPPATASVPKAESITTDEVRRDPKSRVFRSSESHHGVRQASETGSREPRGGTGRNDGVESAAPSLSDLSEDPAISRPRVPLSLSGKPIPPPPGSTPGRPNIVGRYQGDSGRTGDRGQQGSYGDRPPRPNRTGDRGQQGSYGDRPPRPAGEGGYRPGGAPGSGYAGNRGSVPPAPNFTGKAPGAGRGRPIQKAAKRRSRKNIEELEPTQVTSYIPSNAPIPEGEVIIERGSSAQEVGPKLNRSAGDIVRFLLLQGEPVTGTQTLSDDAIELFAAELGARVKLVDPGQEQEAALYAKYFATDDEQDTEEVVLRAPVVTVMGHVDHGKTKLLDRIRETNVVAKEAGGITQHIGAYRAMVADKFVTFIDTPGHEAFTSMRARGASVTDIVVLVVAADDGVMPQTLEAIDHAKAAGVPIVVAINKIDKADADPTRVMQQLSEHGLVPEAWGGDTITVEVSALQNLGVDDLLEQLVVLAEVLELKARRTGLTSGVVLEANLDPGRGPVATVIVQRGILRVGDTIVAGPAFGRVKALVDELGKPVHEAEPSTPVQVLGFSEVPRAGDEFRETTELGIARQIGSMREQRIRIAGLSAQAGAVGGAKLEDLFEQIKRGETATLAVIIKADVQGSLEAVTESLRKLERPEVKLSIVRRAVGGINENDVSLAAASNATLIGFNVRPDRRAREAAEAQHVEIRTYEIIYKMLEDIQAAMVGILAPEFEEVVTGEAEVREVFRVPKIGGVAGCYVQNGVITRGTKVRFLRDGVIIWKGSITSLRRFKDDAREVAAGFECGIGLSDFQDLQRGDVIEAFEDREIPRT